jgi:hypothetical protein
MSDSEFETIALEKGTEIDYEIEVETYCLHLVVMVRIHDLACRCPPRHRVLTLGMT